MKECVTFCDWGPCYSVAPGLSRTLNDWSLLHISVAWCSCIQALVQVWGGGMCGCVYMCVCRLTRKNNRDNRVHQTGRRRGATMKELLILLQFYIKKNIDHSPQ